MSLWGQMTFPGPSSTERLYNLKKEQTLEICKKKLNKILIFPVMMTLMLEIYIRLFQKQVFLVLLLADNPNLA